MESEGRSVVSPGHLFPSCPEYNLKAKRDMEKMDMYLGGSLLE